MASVHTEVGDADSPWFAVEGSRWHFDDEEGHELRIDPGTGDLWILRSNTRKGLLRAIGRMIDVVTEGDLTHWAKSDQRDLNTVERATRLLTSLSPVCPTCGTRDGDLSDEAGPNRCLDLYHY